MRASGPAAGAMSARLCLRYCQIWCTRADRGRFSGGEFLLSRRIVMRRSSVLEGNALQEQFDVFGTVDAAPSFLGFLDQLEGQAKKGRSGHAIARARRAVTHGREG